MSIEGAAKELEREGMRLERTLLSKAGGATFVARVRCGEDVRVIKWVAHTAPARVRDELDRERAFYDCAGGSALAPRYFGALTTATGRALVLELIQGVSLRAWLARYLNAASRDVAAFDAVIARALDAARALYALRMPAALPRAAGQRSAADIFGLLMHSGPVQRQVSELERRLKHGLRAAGSPLESRALRLAGAGLGRHVLIHGDLHWNNVVVRDDGSACLIDFGTAREGDAGLDIAYLASMVGAALPRGSAERRALRERSLALIAALGGDPNAYARLLDTLAIAAAVNSRLQLAPGWSAAQGSALYLPRLARAAALPRVRPETLAP